MDKQLFLLTGLIAFLGCLPDADADGHKKDSTYVNLPNNNFLLSLNDLHKYVVDQQVGEMYFAIQKPPAFVPYYNYKSTIKIVSGTPNYTQVVIGETPGDNSECIRAAVPLAPVSRDKSLFYVGNDVTYALALWSSEPLRYIWSMRCGNYYPGKRKCLLKDTVINVYVNGNLDDIQLLLYEDLCKATGLKFGAETFKWFFTFGENTLC